MIPMTLDEIAAVVGGSVRGPGETLVGGAPYVDSRSPVADGLFVAVVGERVDGHAYAAGAHAVLGSRPTEAPTVVVDDPVAALGRLARHVVDRLRAAGTTVYALTGSQGKTGTKDYLAGVLRVLAGDEHVVATTANNNNELGVPLTALRANADTRHMVLEMGARGIGHIAYLCTIAPPDVAAVINVGTAHVGEFGGREAIAQAKGEIVEALGPDGVAVLNADDDYTAAMAPRTRARVLTFGTDGDVSWRSVELDELGRPSYELGHGDEWRPVRLRQTGAHQVLNAAAAAAMAIGGGAGVAEVAEALATLEAASPWRMELRERADGLVVLNDAYNANPESMRAALDALVAIGERSGRRTFAVLGEMKELGPEHDEGHRSVGAHAARAGVDVVVVVGDAAAGIAVGVDGFRGSAAGGLAPQPPGDDVSRSAPLVVRTVGRDEAAAWVGQNAGAGDVVLVKASRGAALEWVAAQLLGSDLDVKGGTP